MNERDFITSYGGLIPPVPIERLNSRPELSPEKVERKRADLSLAAQAAQKCRVEFPKFKEWDREHKEQIVAEVLTPLLMAWLKVGMRFSNDHPLIRVGLLPGPLLAETPVELFNTLVAAQGQIVANILAYKFEYNHMAALHFVLDLQAAPAVKIDYDDIRQFENEYDLEPRQMKQNYKMELPTLTGWRPIEIPDTAAYKIKHKHISRKAKAEAIGCVWYDLTAERMYHFLKYRELTVGDVDLRGSAGNAYLSLQQLVRQMRASGIPIPAIVGEIAKRAGYNKDEAVDFLRNLGQQASQGSDADKAPKLQEFLKELRGE